LVFNYIQVAVKGHEHSPSPITMFSGLGCRTGGNIEICNVFVLFYLSLWLAGQVEILGMLVPFSSVYIIRCWKDKL